MSILLVLVERTWKMQRPVAGNVCMSRKYMLFIENPVLILKPSRKEGTFEKGPYQPDWST